MTITTQCDAETALARSWPHIVDECRSVLGPELHYQAIAYHCLRTWGDIPVTQIGMNVKMWIPNCVTPLFREYDQSKREGFRGGFEPIPDIVLFPPDIQGDWRRRNRAETLKQMLLAVEIKASERKNSRLSFSEINRDIRKLAAHREEKRYRHGAGFSAVMMVIDTAPETGERMSARDLGLTREAARESSVHLYYVSPETFLCDHNPAQSCMEQVVGQEHRAQT